MIDQRTHFCGRPGAAGKYGMYRHRLQQMTPPISSLTRLYKRNSISFTKKFVMFLSGWLDNTNTEKHSVGHIKLG